MKTRAFLPLYQWRLTRAGKPDYVTRNRRAVSALSRLARKVGGEVIREQVGLVLNTRITAELNALIEEEASS